jgi:GTP-binding protein HflX
VECFKSTLAEVKECDLLLHVVDISSHQFEEQIEVVHQILGEVGAADKPRVLIFNKIDSLKDNDDITVEEYLEGIKNRYQNDQQTCVFISASKELNIDLLKNHLYEKTKTLYLERYPNYLNAGFLNYSEE